MHLPHLSRLSSYSLLPLCSSSNPLGFSQPVQGGQASGEKQTHNTGSTAELHHRLDLGGTPSLTVGMISFAKKMNAFTRFMGTEHFCTFENGQVPLTGRYQ